MTNTLRVLLVEDSPDDAALVVLELRRTNPIEFLRTEDAGAMRAALEREPWDVVLSDWSMPTFSALAALAVLKESGLDIPFIIVSGTIGEESAVEAMRAGAHDFVFKDKLARLQPALERELRECRARETHRQSEARKIAIVETALDAIVGMDHEGRITEFNPAAEKTFGYSREEVLGDTLAEVLVPPRLREAYRIGLARYLATGEGEVIGKRIEISALRRDGTEMPVELAVARGSGALPSFTGFIRDISARRVAEQALRASEERYRLMFDSSPLPMWVYDTETLAFLAVNDAAVRHYGYTREEFATLTLAAIRPPEDVPRLHEDIARRSRVDEGGLWRHRKKNGSIITVEIKAHDFEFEGKPARLVLANDVTERLRLEDQLRQSQKMEAVGRLAGGVAHDFNNALSVILCYGEILLANMNPGEPMRDDVEEIKKAGKRAADLTRQLLMFSRQQVFEPKVLDLNETLTNMDKMLQHILGADVDLVFLPTQRLGRVRVDPGHIEQVIMNLVVNARDAMPTGGKLTMETGNVILDEAYALKHVGVTPGPHVMLAVTDTGIGMDKATLSSIFEPFFTTKEPGKGTGLGLSIVFGIVQQSGGSLWVYSEPGEGTTFKVYLPRVNAEIDPVRSTMPPRELRGSETILLVEDDDQVRAVALGILRKNGYHVIEARSAGEALLLSEKHPGLIHLLLSDVVMPQLSGPELAKRLANARPDIKVLFMSGYTDDSIVRHGVLETHTAYLQKPITPQTLTTKVREVLDASTGGHPS